MNKQWHIPPRIPTDVSVRLGEFPPLIQQILFNRGIADPLKAKEYFHALPPDETSPFLLSGMEKAVDRIIRAINSDEKVIIYGDYDVDGVTATVLLVEALTDLGGKVSPYIPDRFEEGYGINTEALDKLKDEGSQLIISVDCGVRSIQEAAYCHKLGLNLIITDHHSPQDDIPDAYAVIDPKLPGDQYPFKFLAGVGVAYKLAQALFIRSNRVREMGERWLDLVAIGTVADLAPLTDENRFLVRKGLEAIHKDTRLGLGELCRVSSIDPRGMNATHIGFGIGPRLNAAGRMETAMAAYNLLAAQDENQAARLAISLNEQNRARQEETRQVVDSAIEVVLGAGEGQDILFAIDPNFSEGIVGLAASRLVEQFYRPAIVGTYGEEYTRCSCRSIPELDITRALDACADLMEHHGGHAAAAGLTIRNEHLEELKRRLREISAQVLQRKELMPVLNAEAEVKLADLNADIYRQLQYFQPFGYSNPEIQFITRGLKIKSIREVGQEGKHLKLLLTDGWLSVNAIAFSKGYLKESLMGTGSADYLYVYETNEYNGRVDFQLNVKDIKLPE